MASPAPGASAAPRSPLALLSGFTAGESRLVFGMSAIYASRMLGVYMAMPVLSPYAESLPASTSIWVGLSVGAYGLTQAIFQIPLGLLGDRIGRGKALGIGLAIFGAGSALCAFADTAPVLVAGRFLQGAGAMASTMIALFGDRTREEVRTRAMAGMGIFLGAAFALGLVAGPSLASAFGVPLLFGVAAAASVVGLGFLPWTIRSREPVAPPSRSPSVAEAVRAIRKPALLSLDLGILVLHLGLTVLFVILPLRLERYLDASRQWIVYAPALVIGFVALLVFSRLAEGGRAARLVIAAGSASLVAGHLVLAFAEGLLSLGVALACVAIGFAAVEPALAAQVTRHSRALFRGTAAGVFNTVQFLGVFVGGLAAGAVLRRAEAALFVAIALAQIGWLWATWSWLAARHDGDDEPGDENDPGAGHRGREPRTRRSGSPR